MADLYVCPEHGETNPCSGCRAETDLPEPPDRIFINRAAAVRYSVEQRRIGDIEYSRAPAAPVVDSDRVEEIRRWRERFTSYHSDHTVALNRAFGYIDYLLERVGAAATAAPVEQSDVTEELRDTNMLCRSGEGRPKVEIWFKDLKAAQKVHRWLVSLAANTNEGAR